uniref:Uncharacterized protein n=1 Tax=viral metagenome TaxID=1070528 RepID=A0A6M3IWT1_9ZZZZ
MKLINYNYGYNNTFDCSIHGKIIVNKVEWKAILKYLFNPAVTSYYLYKHLLKEDITRLIETKKGKLCNIRVAATEKAVNKFNIKKYKRGNYMFLVTN